MAISFWEKQHFYTFDIIIVGAGIVGLSSAYYLQKRFPKRKIAILDKGFLPHGASTRNAGFACFGSISELIEQEQSLGNNGLKSLVKKRWQGLQRLRTLLGDNQMDFQQNGGFEIFRKRERELEKASFEKTLYYNQLLGEIIGEPEIFKPRNEKIRAFEFRDVSGMIENTCEGQIHTGKMMYSLLQRVTAEGVLLLQNCEVTSYQEEEKRIHLQSNQGSFTASQVLFCTNAFTGSLLPELDIIPGRGQVLMTKAIPGLKLKGTFHYNRGYDYFRNVGNRILLGGGRDIAHKNEETQKFGITQEITDHLLELLSTVIYENPENLIEYQWSGIMAFGKKASSPIVKQIRPRLFFAGRSGGMGVALGTQLGFEASKLIPAL